MGSIWGQKDPGVSHVGPMNFAILESLLAIHWIVATNVSTLLLFWSLKLFIFCCIYFPNISKMPFLLYIQVLCARTELDYVLLWLGNEEFFQSFLECYITSGATRSNKKIIWIIGELITLRKKAQKSHLYALWDIVYCIFVSCWTFITFSQWFTCR